MDQTHTDSELIVSDAVRQTYSPDRANELVMNIAVIVLAVLVWQRVKRHDGADGQGIIERM